MFFRFFEKDALQHSLGNLYVTDGTQLGSFDPDSWDVYHFKFNFLIFKFHFNLSILV